MNEIVIIMALLSYLNPEEQASVNYMVQKKI